ncbi:MAG: hypothetical protein ABW208_23260 [Pyrinomonadaceae bacterium]
MNNLFDQLSPTVTPEQFRSMVEGFSHYPEFALVFEYNHYIDLTGASQTRISAQVKYRGAPPTQGGAPAEAPAAPQVGAGGGPPRDDDPANAQPVKEAESSKDERSWLRKLVEDKPIELASLLLSASTAVFGAAGPTTTPLIIIPRESISRPAEIQYDGDLLRIPDASKERNQLLERLRPLLNAVGTIMSGAVRKLDLTRDYAAVKSQLIHQLEELRHGGRSHAVSEGALLASQASLPSHLLEKEGWRLESMIHMLSGLEIKPSTGISMDDEAEAPTSRTIRKWRNVVLLPGQYPAAEDGVTEAHAPAVEGEAEKGADEG